MCVGANMAPAAEATEKPKNYLQAGGSPLCGSGKCFLVIAPYSHQVLNGSASLALSAPPQGGTLPQGQAKGSLCLLA